MTRVWLVRLGEYGEAEAYALETGELATGWCLPNFTKALDRAAILAELQAAYPDEKPGTLKNWSVQLNQLCNKASEGDLTVTPLKTASRQLAIGRIKGGFLAAKGQHPARKVEWLHTDLPRDALKQDLLYSLGASQTLCEISRNNAASRFEEIVKTRRDPGDSALPDLEQSNGDKEDAETESAIDLVELARDQIERHISSAFVGHAFTRLIDAILQADGYQTKVSPPGSDKGIDIVAGQRRAWLRRSATRRPSQVGRSRCRPTYVAKFDWLHFRCSGGARTSRELVRFHATCSPACERALFPCASLGPRRNPECAVP